MTWYEMLGGLQAVSAQGFIALVHFLPGGEATLVIYPPCGNAMHREWQPTVSAAKKRCEFILQ